VLPGALPRRAPGGGDIRICYSPLDAVDVAASQPGKQTVFLAVGFETTAPANCLAIKKAQQAGLRNFSLLCACKTMEQAYYKLRGAADAFPLSRPCVGDNGDGRLPPAS
jgi:hydrogenase expression/formation protein HypD